MKYTKDEIQESIERLREMLKPGDKVYTNVLKVAPSGMSRHIALYIVRNGEIQNITYDVGRALELTRDRNTYGLRVSGCGMDMCFHTVYSLGRVLFPDGFKLAKGQYGRNGDKSGFDKDGGYALKKSDL